MLKKPFIVAYFTLRDTWYSKPIEIALKIHLNLYNIHSDILVAEKPI